MKDSRSLGGVAGPARQGRSIPSEALHAASTRPVSTGETEYRALPLVDLLTRITESGDRAALNEFHSHRRIFDGGAGTWVLFLEYLGALCSSDWAVRRAGSNMSTIETARDLTLDRFLNIPTRPGDEAENVDGPDCR